MARKNENKKKMFLVMGLGVFGRQAARALAENHMHVLALDVEERPVEMIRNDVDRAVRVDVTNDEALQEIGAFDADVAIISLGRHFDLAVLATHTLKQRGIKHIHVQVDSEKEAEAIRAVGATNVIFPERDMAYNLVRRLVTPNIADQIPVDDDHGLIEMQTPKDFIGNSLSQLDVRKKHGVFVVAVRRPGNHGHKPKLCVPPDPDEPLEEGSTLFIIGHSERLNKLADKYS